MADEAPDESAVRAAVALAWLSNSAPTSPTGPRRMNDQGFHSASPPSPFSRNTIMEAFGGLRPRPAYEGSDEDEDDDEVEDEDEDEDEDEEPPPPTATGRKRTWPRLHSARGLPTSFAHGRRVQLVAKHIKVIKAIERVTKPAGKASQLNLSKGHGCLSDRVTTVLGRTVNPGLLNAIVREIFGRSTKQPNVCRLCFKGCSKANCGSHYKKSISLGRNRVMVISGMSLR